MSLPGPVLVDGDHHILIGSLGQQCTVTNLGLANVYYSSSSNVGPTRNEGVLGQSQSFSFTQPQMYVIADVRTTITIDYTPIASQQPTGGGGGGGGQSTSLVVGVADMDYPATAADGTIAYTALTAPRKVTLPLNPSDSQEISIVDQSGKADRFPIIVLGTINGGPAAVLKDAFGQIDLSWDGGSWTTSAWSATARPITPKGTIYYVSPTGSNSNLGTSPDKPWQTVGKVNSAKLNAGDAVLFQGGQTFSDTYLNPGFNTAWNGTAGSRIIIGSYGNGQATLSKGVFFDGTQGTYLVFDNLRLLSDTNAQCFQAGSTGSAANIRVQRCEMSQPDTTSNSSPAVITKGTGFEVVGNYIHDVGSHGIQAQVGSGSHLIYQNLIYNIGLNSSLVDNQHHMYLSATSTVSANVCIGTPNQVGFPNSSSAISCRVHDTAVIRNHVACCAAGTDFYSQDTVAGTWRCVGNRLMGIGTTTGGYGIYVTEDSEPLIEGWWVTENVVDMAGTGNSIDLSHATTSSTTQSFGNVVGAVATSSGGGGGGGGGGASAVFSTTNLPFGSFVLVDTSSIATYSGATTYNGGDLAYGSNGTLYQSIAATNLNHDPTTDDGTHWVAAPLTIDGNALSALYSSPPAITGTAPKQAYAIPFGQKTFAFAPTYSGSTTYGANSTVIASDKQAYKSIAGGNLNHDPTTDAGAHWSVATNEKSVTQFKVVFNTGPWYGQGDAYSSDNTTYWGGSMAGIAGSTAPSPSNNFSQGYGFYNSASLRNGYSYTSDPAPATSAVVITAPGDQPGATADTRAEMNLYNNYGTGQTWAPSSTVDGWKNRVDPLSIRRQIPRAIRFDFQFLANYTAPILVANSTNSAWVTHLHSRTPSSAYKSWVVDFAGAVASATVAPTSAQWNANMGNLSNLNEDNGPAMFAWASGSNNALGALGGFQFRYAPYSGGNSTGKTLVFDPVKLSDLGLVAAIGGSGGTDSVRVSTIVEHQNGLCATAGGVPWILTALPTWSNSLPGQFALQTGAVKAWSSSSNYSIGAVILGSNSQLYRATVASGPANGGAADPTTDGGAHWATTTYTWSSTVNYASGAMAVGSDQKFYLANASSGPANGGAVDPVTDNGTKWVVAPQAPYGVPRDNTGAIATAGGGWIRAWRDITGTGAFQCVSQNLVDGAGNPLSVPGTATYDPSTGTITESATGAGKIYGPNQKGAAAQLNAQVSNGATSMVLKNIAANTSPAFENQGSGWGVIVDGTNSETIWFTGYNNSTGTITGIPSSGTGSIQKGPHAAGTQFAGTYQPIALSPGINQGQGLTSPFAARIWPVLTGPDMASVATPASSMP